MADVAVNAVIGCARIDGWDDVGAPKVFGRLLAYYAWNLITKYSVSVTSPAAMVKFMAQGTITSFTR